METGTFVILDGLQAPRLGRALSAAWVEAGFINQVDVSGQWARLAVREESNGPLQSLTEAQSHAAGRIARRFGIELRDRAGAKFIGDNDLAALRSQVIYEYRMRLAQALVFVLPALVLRYVSPVLAPGAAEAGGERSMVFPWLFEMLLVGWACWAGGWPILWQGTLALFNRRWTGDLLTTVIVIAGFLPSALGVIGMVWFDRPWFGEGGPTFHAAGIALIVALYQRWSAHRYATELSGRAHWLTPHVSRVVGLWLIVGFIACLGGWRVGLSALMLLPPLFALGGVSRLTPGLSAALPVFGFSAMFLLGQGVMNANLDAVRFETAGGFALMLALSYEWGWRKLTSEN